MVKRDAPGWGALAHDLLVIVVGSFLLACWCLLAVVGGAVIAAFALPSVIFRRVKVEFYGGKNK